MRIQYIIGDNLVIILNKYDVLDTVLDDINQPRQSSAQFLGHHKDHLGTKMLQLTSLAF